MWSHGTANGFTQYRMVYTTLGVTACISIASFYSVCLSIPSSIYRLQVKGNIQEYISVRTSNIPLKQEDQEDQTWMLKRIN